MKFASPGEVGLLGLAGTSVSLSLCPMKSAASSESILTAEAVGEGGSMARRALSSSLVLAASWRRPRYMSAISWSSSSIPSNSCVTKMQVRCLVLRGNMQAKSFTRSIIQFTFPVFSTHQGSQQTITEKQHTLSTKRSCPKASWAAAQAHVC